MVDSVRISNWNHPKEKVFVEGETHVPSKDDELHAMAPLFGMMDSSFVVDVNLGPFFFHPHGGWLCDASFLVGSQQPGHGF